MFLFGPQSHWTRNQCFKIAKFWMISCGQDSQVVKEVVKTDVLLAAVKRSPIHLPCTLSG